MQCTRIKLHQHAGSCLLSPITEQPFLLSLSDAPCSVNLLKIVVASLFFQCTIYFGNREGPQVNLDLLPPWYPDPKRKAQTIRSGLHPNRDKGSNMTIRTLSKATIASLPAIEGQWWDDKLPGFGYRQRKPKADGSVYASYVVHYRFGGEQKKFTLGDARRINADQARKAALKLFGEIVSGIDPQAVKQSERIEAAKLTFSEAVAQYLEHKRTEVRESSLQNMRTYLTGAAYFPALHNKAIDAVTNAEVAARVDRIGREIGGPTAGQARAILSSFYSWAWKRGLCPTNIVLATEAPKADSSRKRTLTDDELKRV